MQYTQQDKANALETSLTRLASCMGYTPRRVGNCYTLAEMDSIRIYNDRTWYRWSGNGSRIGGTQIDFVLEFGNASTVPEAVHQLLNLQGISPEYRAVENKEYTTEKKDFKLPYRAQSYRIAYAYLIKTRGLSKEVVDYFVKNKLMYEDKDYHNLIFVGRDSAGTIKYATKHGTRDAYGQKFKGDVPGNDKNYGVNIVNKDSDVLKVFEASIDCMSYMDITGDYTSNKLILGMVEDNPLRTFLKENPNIKKIDFCLDNDIAAKSHIYGQNEVRDDKGCLKKERVVGYLDKYRQQGYAVSDQCAPVVKDGSVKDYNEYLQYLKKTEPASIAVLNNNQVKRKCR